MKNGLCSVTLALALAVPAVAHAGARTTREVSIDSVARRARGSLSAAYNSADAEQLIECWFNAADDNSSSGGCRAFTKEGSRSAWAYCTFSDTPSFATAVTSLSSDSYLEFSWDPGGSCSYILVVHGSTQGPKL